MSEVLTVAEYTAANNARRALHSQLVKAEIEATREALARLKTVAGKLALKREANSRAARYLKNALKAQRIAQLEMLRRASVEDEELGRQRLLAATAEMYGEDEHKPKRGRGRPRTTEHGLQMYKSGRCKCDEVCRPANAAAQQQYKVNLAYKNRERANP